MKDKEYKIFDMFENQWALVTAGSRERFNCCTVGWGGMGVLWNRPVVTVYLHPARYTREFLAENDCFTLSFFPEKYRKALGILGTLSGRDGDKIAASGLTLTPMGESVSYREAELSFLCRKLYKFFLGLASLCLFLLFESKVFYVFFNIKYFCHCYFLLFQRICLKRPLIRAVIFLRFMRLLLELF